MPVEAGITALVAATIALIITLEAGITALVAATIPLMITLEAGIMAVLALFLAVMHLLSWLMTTDTDGEDSND